MIPTGETAVPGARQGMPRTSFFTNESMIRRVQRESVVALSGPRTLLMQAAHPVAFAGFFAHTGALDDPYARLQRTVRVLGLIGFGDKAEAQKATARVRDIHTRVNGSVSEPAGRLPRRHAVLGERPRPAAVDPRLHGGLGAGRLPALRALAVARRARR